MKNEHEKTIIGYSGFILFEECYEYNENACYIAESRNLAEQFMIDCGYGKSDFRVDEITIKDLMNDYGCSSGEYAMEKLAYENFKMVANKNEIKYSKEGFDLDTSLKVINIKGV